MFGGLIPTLRDAPDAGGLVSPETIKQRRLMARKLMEQGGDFSPVGHWTQGLARVASGLRGSLEDYYTTQDEKAGQSAAQAGLAGLFSGAPAAPTVAAPANPMNINPQAGPVGAPQNPMAVPANLAPIFKAQEEENELPPGYLSRTAQIESSMNPNARNPNSSAGGLFQFIDGTAKDYGLANKFDPAQSTRAAAELAWDNKETLTKTLGRAPTAAELYLAHQQGGEGAAKLLANPNARAADVVGADAVRLNGGDANMTAGQFANKWLTKFDGAAPAATQAQAQAPAQTGAQSDMFKRAFSLMNSPAFAYLADGQKQAVQAIVNRGLSQEAADPVKQALTVEQLKAARLGNAEAERKAKAVEIETKEAPDGQVWEREKGVEGAQWKPSIKLGSAPQPPKFRELNGRVYQEMPDGTLQDRTPQGSPTGYTPMNPEQRKAFNVPDGTPAFMGPDGKPQFGPASRAEQGEFGKAADKQMAEYFKTHADGGTQASAVLNSMEVLREVGQAAPQGGVQGRIASAFPGFSTNADVFNSQVKTIAPQLRVPGSGATSDKDLDTFMAALPNLKNTPEANKAILGIVETKAQLNLERAEIARKALRREIPAEEADKQLRELDKRSILTPEVRTALGIKSAATTNRPATPGAGPRILSVEPIR